MTSEIAWRDRMDAAWSRLDALPPEDFVALVDALAAERPPGDPEAIFERACARDSVGLEREAETLYRAALATGALDAYRRTRAALQLGSTLRWLGCLDESEAILKAELDRQVREGDTTLRDEARALLACTWLAMGRDREAAGLALAALAPRLSRYQRSLGRHAATFVDDTWA